MNDIIDDIKEIIEKMDGYDSVNCGEIKISLGELSEHPYPEAIRYLDEISSELDSFLEGIINHSPGNDIDCIEWDLLNTQYSSLRILEAHKRLYDDIFFSVLLQADKDLVDIFFPIISRIRGIDSIDKKILIFSILDSQTFEPVAFEKGLKNIINLIDDTGCLDNQDNASNKLLKGCLLDAINEIYEKSGSNLNMIASKLTRNIEHLNV